MPRRGQRRALEEAFGSPVKAVVQAAIDPIEIERQDERASDARIGKQRPPGVED
jgi:hypothetical protein